MHIILNLSYIYIRLLCPVLESESSPTLWDLELAKEIATSCEQPFRNGFEEMIQWTNEGKLWTFPIDNEAGKQILFD